MVVGSVAWVGYKFLLLTANLDELVGRHLELRDVVEVYLGTIGPVAATVSLSKASGAH